MSRKDRRRVVMVELTPALLRAVRARAEGRRGLGDTMRLMLESALDLAPPAATGPAPAATTAPLRRLALQLPKAERRQLAELQARTGLGAGELVRRCLEAAVAKTGHGPVGHGIVAPTHHSGDCDATLPDSGRRAGRPGRSGTGR